MPPNLTKVQEHKNSFLYIGLFLFFVLWQWNGLIYDLWTGFDMGVQNMELLTAASGQLHYGKDLLVTPYPPLSWLYKGVVPVLTAGYGEALFQTITMNVFSAFLRVVIIALFWKDAKSTPEKVLAAVASVLVFLRFSVTRGTTLLDLCILTASLLVCKLLFALQNGKTVPGRGPAWTAAIVAAVSILLSIPQLAKFSYIAMAAALLIITAVILLVYKRYVEIALLMGGYAASTCLLWVLSGEQLQYLPSYVHAMLQFVSGYSEVMSLPFSAYENAFRDLLFALAVCVGYGLMLLYLLVRDRLKAAAWFIIAPFIFLAFKEAFVRSDQHTMYFAEALPFVLCYLLYVFQRTQEDGKTSPIVIPLAKKACCVLLALLLVSDFVANGWYPSSTIYEDINRIDSQEKYELLVENDKNAVRMTPEYQILLQDIEPYPDSTLGMLSGEQTFFIAHDLIDRFKMNPIISLWENFTSYSETVAAAHYRGDDAPDVLLYRPEPLDNGYFIFRMGTILQALLENYRVDKVDEYGYLVLRRSEPNQQEPIPLGEPAKAVAGSPVEIPTVENAFVFMKVDWKPTLLGKLAAFILKPPPTQVTIQTAGGGQYDYRFFRTLANNGLYVSSFIDTPQDLAELVSGELGYDTIESVTLQGDPLFYQKDFHVSFYAVPFTTEQAAYQSERSHITVTFASALPAGDYQFFYAQDGMFTGEQMEARFIGGGQTELAGRIPSEGWNTLRMDFPSQAGEYDILSITCDGKTGVIDSANDAEVTKTEHGWHVKAGDYDPFITFHLVEEGKEG